MFALETEGLARKFGAHWVLRGVSLQVRPGEVVGLLGANGSGKTTMLRVLATLLKPSAGAARVYGHDVVREPDAVRGNIGFLAHGTGLYEDLTARENLEFATNMLGIGTTGIDAALDQVGLTRVTHNRVRGFSAGMQRRLALARLILAKPKVLLFDEPYSNLDSAGIALMNEVIAESARNGGAALVVLHELAPAAGLFNRTVTLQGGRFGESMLSASNAELAVTAGAR